MKNKKMEIIFPLIFVLIGITLLFFGVKSTYSMMEKTKNYVSVEGTFIGSSIYSSDDDGTKYKLTYSYRVSGNKYEISTNYGTGVVPDIGTKKNIKYNPDNPSEAIITGLGSNGLLLLLGFMFTTIPLIPLLSIFVNSNNFISSKVKEKIFGIYLGTVFIILGGACYYMMCYGSDSLSIIYAFKTTGFWIIIPVIFIVLGIYIVTASILYKNKNNENIKNFNEVIPDQNSDTAIENQVFEEKVDNIVDKVEQVSSIAAPIVQIIVGLIFTGSCVWIFILRIDIATKMIIVPFIICGLAVLLKGVISLIQCSRNLSSNNYDYNNQEKNEIINKNLNNFQVVTSRIYIIGFLIFWFGFLILMDYESIKKINDGGLQLILFSLIFWAAGIFVVYQAFRKIK